MDFNDELRKKESGDVGPMKERVADEERETGKVRTELIKDSGVMIGSICNPPIQMVQRDDKAAISSSVSMTKKRYGLRWVLKYR